MLELKDFDGKVLVSYLREPDTYSAVLDWTILGPNSHVEITKGAYLGVVVALDKNVIGWSLCSKRDVIDKKKGLSIALNRAVKASLMTAYERQDFYESIPFSLDNLIEDMDIRAEEYFK